MNQAPKSALEEQKATQSYQPKMSLTWWLTRRNYFKFMVREITSVFVALYLMTLLLFVTRLGDSTETMQAHLQALREPLWVFFHVVVLGFALFHSVTWFNLTPKVMVVWLGEERVPGWILAGSNRPPFPPPARRPSPWASG